VFLRMSC